MSLPGENTLLRLLEPFAEALALPGTREIVVNQPGRFGVEGSNGWTWHEAPELTYRRLDAIGALVASRVARRLGPDRPTVSSFLPGKERITVARPPASAAGTVLVNIRRRAKDFTPTLEWLGSVGYFDHVPAYDADWWQAKVNAGATIVVCGGIGSSKTTFTEALLRANPPERRVVTVEGAPEWLDLPLPNLAQLYFDGIRRTATDCLQDAMRMRPDDIPFQELLGGEAWAFMRARIIGHRTFTTVHAANCPTALDAITLMVRQSDEGRAMEEKSVRALLNQHIDIIAHCARDPFRVTEVMELRS